MDTILSSKSKSLSILIDRNGRSLTMDVTPGWIDNTDVYGAHLETRGIGVSPAGESAQNTVYIPILAAKAPLIAMVQTWRIVDVSLVGVWRMVSHRADASQLTGVIGIAGVSQKAASQGLYDLISLIAFISVSIGLINLFPIPLLDGGHLLYYGCEAVLGRPLGERVQDVGFQARAGAGGWSCDLRRMERLGPVEPFAKPRPAARKGPIPPRDARPEIE